MNDNDSLQEVINDVSALARHAARGNPAKLTLSKETAEMLNAVGTTPPPPAKAETEPMPEPVPEPTPEPDASPLAAVPQPKKEENEMLTKIAKEVTQCQKCPLAALRTNPVPGEGNPKASLVFVGEAPGASEDRLGRPFVGRAGNLLNDIIVKGMRMDREEVFICNVVKCRPPENRVPNPEEVRHCEPYLIRQLEAIRPKVICALGATAAQTMLKTNATIRSLRGVWHNYQNIPLRVTYHPAYLLRNPEDKKKTWEDIQEVMRVLSGEVTPEI